MGKGYRIGTNTQRLADGFLTLNECFAAVKEQWNRMYALAEELQMMWEGAAQKEFHRQFLLDYENAKDTMREVETMLECLGYARGQYECCEEKIREKIAALPVRD